MAETRRVPPRESAERSLAVVFLTFVAKVVQWLLLAWILSVLIEWVGMTWWWPEKGTEHSRVMLDIERSNLDRGFRRHVFSSNASAFGSRLVNGLSHALFGLTHIDAVIKWAITPPAEDETRLRATIHRAANALADYLIAAKQITQVFGTRLSILLLASPVLALFAIVGFVDGLVRRELRRWGGGRESAFVYHWTKRIVLPAACSGWVVYLLLPTSVSPQLIITPSACAFGIIVSIIAASFKKYL